MQVNIMLLLTKIGQRLNGRYLTRPRNILVLCIISVGIILRLASLRNYIWFQQGYDESRDMLVAKHIVEYGEWLWRGPYAAGGQNILLNSPVYYYLLAIFWFIARSPYGVMLFW